MAVKEIGRRAQCRILPAGRGINWPLDSVFAEITTEEDGKVIYLCSVWANRSLPDRVTFRASDKSIFDASDRIGCLADSKEELCDVLDRFCGKELENKSDYKRYYIELLRMIEREIRIIADPPLKEISRRSGYKLFPIDAPASCWTLGSAFAEIAVEDDGNLIYLFAVRTGECGDYCDRRVSRESVFDEYDRFDDFWDFELVNELLDRFCGEKLEIKPAYWPFFDELKKMIADIQGSFGSDE